MFSKVLWSIFALVCLRVHSIKNSMEEFHQKLISSWCEFTSIGISYSNGEYFWCLNEKPEILSDFGRLKRVTLKVGMMEGSDFEYDCSVEIENGKSKPKDSYSQYLLLVLQEILQFEIEYVSSTSWGYQKKTNHTWEGFTKLLAFNKTDMIGCHWTETEHLTHIADYLFSTLETTESFVYLPENIPLMEDVFVAAFSRKLWVFFLLSIFLLVVSFRFSTYVHSRVRPDHEPWSWDEVVLWAVAAVSQQSYSRHPRGSSCRTMFLIGYLVAYLLYTGFAAGITSLLALQNHQNQLTLRNVADMKLKLILHRDEYYLDFFEKYVSEFANLKIQWIEGESLHQIFYKIRQTNFLGFDHNNISKKEVEKLNFGIIPGSTVTLLHYLLNKVNVDNRRDYFVVVIPDSFTRKAFLVRKFFPYKRIFNYWLLRMKEIGLLNLGKMRYLKTEETARLEATKWFSAGLGNVFSAVVFLFAGWILSLFILLMEILTNKNRKKIIKKL